MGLGGNLGCARELTADWEELWERDPLQKAFKGPFWPVTPVGSEKKRPGYAGRRGGQDIG